MARKVLPPWRGPRARPVVEPHVYAGNVARRTILRTYQLAARLWLTAAGLAFLLPDDARLGLWLPLHLALAGAVSLAISGAMQNFALTLSAAPEPPMPVVWLQFSAANLGVAFIAVGYPSGTSWLVAVGGAAFVTAALVLGWLVLRARRVGLNRRHTLPFVMYVAAIASVIAGGTVGAVIGSHAIGDPDVWLALRRAHPTLNVLGWASLTIAGTLVTFLPTVLRIRMPVWHGAATGALLVGGVTARSLGLGIDLPALATLGTVSFAGGALGLGWMVVKVLRTPRKWPIPVAAKHLVAALAWFIVGSLALVWVMRDGAEGVDAFRDPFLAIFVLGWVVQTLLGAWEYLLPMSRPGHPEDRRRWLTSIEAGGVLQVVALNLGVVLLALAHGWGRDVGVWLATAGVTAALLKAWAYPILGLAPGLAGRRADVWG